jgi:hypothetical protein
MVASSPCEMSRFGAPAWVALFALVSCASATPDRDPTWALVRNPAGGEPAYVWQRADALPVSVGTIVAGPALAPPSALSAYWPPPGPIASIHGFSATVVSRGTRGQSREVMAGDAEQCRMAAGMVRRDATGAAASPSPSPVLVDGEVVSFQGGAEDVAVKNYSGCMTQRGYTVTLWSARAG